MSKTYFIDLEIDACHSTETIKKILQEGESLGCTYFLPNFFEVDPSTLQKLSVGEATNIIALGKKVSDDMIQFIVIKKMNTFFYLFILPTPLHTEISITHFLYPLLRNFDDDEDIDIAHYIKILLDISRKFKVLNLNVYKK